MRNRTTASPSEDYAFPALRAYMVRKDADQCFSILEIVTKNDVTEDDLRLAAKWMRSLLMSTEPIGVLQHATLLAMVRTGFAFNKMSVSNLDLFTLAFHMSWDHLTGESHTDSIPSDLSVGSRDSEAPNSIPYLPSRVFKTCSEADRVVYDTVFHLHLRRSRIFAPIRAGQSSLQTFSRRLTNSAFFNRSFGLGLGAGIVMLWVPVLRELILGAVAGMIGASINEYTVHLGVGHSSDKMAVGFRKLGIIGQFAEEINLAHRVHHSKMLTDFRCEFSDDKVRRRVDAYMQAEARKLVMSRVKSRIYEEDRIETETARIISELKSGGYGVDGTLAGCISMNILALPFFLMNFLVFKAIGVNAEGFAFLISSCFFLSGFIMQSLFSHRYLHMTPEDVQASIPLGTTTAFMRWFMTTSLGQLQTRRHYRHHQEKYSYEKTVNGVIMSFSFADFIFRRGVDEAQLSHLIMMRKEGFLNYPSR